METTVVPLTCLEYIKILSNSLRSAKAATTFGVALALMYIFNAMSLSTVYTKGFTIRITKKLQIIIHSV